MPSYARSTESADARRSTHREFGRSRHPSSPVAPTLRTIGHVSRGPSSNYPTSKTAEATPEPPRPSYKSTLDDLSSSPSPPTLSNHSLSFLRRAQEVSSRKDDSSTLKDLESRLQNQQKERASSHARRSPSPPPLRSRASPPPSQSRAPQLVQAPAPHPSSAPILQERLKDFGNGRTNPSFGKRIIFF